MSELRRHFKPIKRSTKQSGFALVVSMVLLAIITLLSVSSMRSTNIETKIATNHQLKELSFQAAESALSIITGTSTSDLVTLYNLDVPSVVGNTAATGGFYASSGTDQASSHADIEMTYEEFIDPKQGMGNRLFSGYQFDVSTHLFRVDSTGIVDGSGTQTHNRMQVALIRQ
ncbi:MAG: PilX N-terminal domain-containing pilus assembly protein [Candidatus Thiodiazotropha taylori]|nr:PilX N-terminal domain-containing pilus assembly protein [Shewanella sp.]MCG7928207.1 PilX N-terminal domain-containing pilus assembly protein [Candidatus Thiodiazotropha taylori]MCG7935890.1 PilX N-terminal domain-containing pilus assembly protein [Candidatus Thiodiazotropha taylori]MCG8052259.1 PilX N-terminal domain-containing pilus assembly protein [Candidatus Thiodiazotropha taylori]MCG8082378.1 PilX N-terminal domain-containing pilus assembly protein [Candidatus Thiodiazotropha taylori